MKFNERFKRIRETDERAPCHNCCNISGDGCGCNFWGGCILSGVVRLNFAFYTEMQIEGLVFLSSRKKMGFLSDPKYMSYKGFQTADKAEPYFELMYLPFKEGAPLLWFRDSVRRQEDMPE